MLAFILPHGVRGTKVDYDENKKEFTHFGPQWVVLKLLDDSNEPGKKFFDEVSNNFHLKLIILIQFSLIYIIITF